MTLKFRVKNLELANQGKDSIYIAESRMPALLNLRRRFEQARPLEGITVGACLHVTRETAVLVNTLRAGGALVSLCGSNPLSTQDDVAAALAEEGVHVYAWRGNESYYYDSIRSVLDYEPDILIDDGADLIVTAHRESKVRINEVFGGQEETTTGVSRLRAMQKSGILRMPVIAVNDARVKTLFDNRYGTGQGVVSAIKALNVLFAGKTVVIAGYGHCSWGMATRADGLGSNVIVTEVNPIRALNAVMDGYRVLPMKEAIRDADMVFTSTGCRDVVTGKHIEKMKDGAILANLGHFNIEISVKDLEEISVDKRRLRENVDEYTLKNGRRIYLIGEGRLANLVVLGGHPPEIMDLSFSIQAASAEYLCKNHEELNNEVYAVPSEIDEEVARVKLETMNVMIDTLTDAQRAYMDGFEMGT